MCVAALQCPTTCYMEHEVRLENKRTSIMVAETYENYT